MANKEEETKGAYIRVREVAKRLDVTRATIYKWVETGKIPGNKFGPRTVRIPREAYEAWEAKTRVDRSEAPPKNQAPEPVPIAA